jgi:type IV pilus biogenesis protein CpaD/CtpE
MRSLLLGLAAAAAALVGGCATQDKPTPAVPLNLDPYPSTYAR